MDRVRDDRPWLPVWKADLDCAWGAGILVFCAPNARAARAFVDQQNAASLNKYGKPTRVSRCVAFYKTTSQLVACSYVE